MLNFKRILRCRFMAIALMGMFIVNATAKDQPWSIRMAESVMIRDPNGYGNWGYETGTVLRGFEELWCMTGEKKYYDYIKQTVDIAIEPNGTISGYRLSDYNIDQINEGRMVMLVYKETNENRYQTAAQILRRQLQYHPRTSEGGFWHKKRYPDQMWLDGLYMGSPFYAEYCILFNEPENLTDVVKQLTLMEDHARDSVTGLLYHGWSERKEQSWADPMTGCSPSFWGRAIGWYAMAAVDVLDFLPSDHVERDRVIAIVQRLAEAIVNVQDVNTGTWWQVMDQENRAGNYHESSASCMLVYMLAKSIRLGYIDESYRPAVQKGYQGILDEFITENTDGTINLENICRTAGLGNDRDGTYNYYVNETEIVTNDGKGVGPFISASVEVELLNMSKTWLIDNTESIAGYPTQVLGTPEVIETDRGPAVEFNGSDEALVVNANPVAGMDEFTIEVIFKPYQTTDSRNKEQRFIHMQESNNRRLLIELRITDDNQWFLDTFIKNNTSSKALFAEAFPHPIGDWYHAALIYKNGEMKHYVNGVHEMTGQVNYQAMQSGTTSIGTRLNRVSWYKGAIQKLKVTSRALSESEFMLLDTTIED